MYPVIWEVIGKAECVGLRVVAITADEAAQNRKFFKLHKDANETNVANGVVYKTSNVYAPERDIYFFSDFPHLIKTTRNCWEKSKFGGSRLLQVSLELYTYRLNFNLRTDKQYPFYTMCLSITERRSVYSMEAHRKSVPQEI